MPVKFVTSQDIGYDPLDLMQHFESADTQAAQRKLMGQQTEAMRRENQREAKRDRSGYTDRMDKARLEKAETEIKQLKFQQELQEKVRERYPDLYTDSTSSALMAATAEAEASILGYKNSEAYLSLESLMSKIAAGVVGDADYAATLDVLNSRYDDDQDLSLEQFKQMSPEEQGLFLKTQHATTQISYETTQELAKVRAQKTGSKPDTPIVLMDNKGVVPQSLVRMNPYTHQLEWKVGDMEWSEGPLPEGTSIANRPTATEQGEGVVGEGSKSETTQIRSQLTKIRNTQNIVAQARNYSGASTDLQQMIRSKAEDITSFVERVAPEQLGVVRDSLENIISAEQEISDSVKYTTLIALSALEYSSTFSTSGRSGLSAIGVEFFNDMLQVNDIFQDPQRLADRLDIVDGVLTMKRRELRTQYVAANGSEEGLPEFTLSNPVTTEQTEDTIDQIMSRGKTADSPISGEWAKDNWDNVPVGSYYYGPNGETLQRTE